MGKSGSVPCGVTAPFSWVLVHIRFCLCPPRVSFPVLCQFWWFYGGVNDDLLQEGLCHTQVGLLHLECLPLWQSTADPYLHMRHSNTVLSQSLWGLWVLAHTRFVWALLAFLTGMGFDSKHDFARPTVLLGLLLCSWMWVISSEPLQCPILQ